MDNAFAQAEAAGVKRFVASDHVTVRRVGSGEGVNPADPDQAPGAEDPHLWMDPLTVRAAMDALAGDLATALGIDVTARAKDLDARLAALDERVAATLAVVPTASRTLVTGHESLGYFAQRYDLRLIGAIVPSLTTAAEPSAADLAALATKIRDAKVGAIFTELGTSPKVAEAIGKRDRGESRRARDARAPGRWVIRDLHGEHRHHDRRQSALRRRAGRAGPRSEEPPAGTADRPLPRQRVHAARAGRGRARLDRLRDRGHVRRAARPRLHRRRARPRRPAGDRAIALLIGVPGHGRGGRRGAGDDRRRQRSITPARGSRRTPRSACCSWACWPSAS